MPLTISRDELKQAIEPGEALVVETLGEETPRSPPINW